MQDDNLSPKPFPLFPSIISTVATCNPTPEELMLFHRLERDLFARLLRHLLNPNRERLKLVFALWLWLESIGRHSFISHVAACRSPDLLLAFVREAESCLDRLLLVASAGGDPDGYELPLTSSLTAEEIDLRFFDAHRGRAVSGVRYFFRRVCEVIFDDDAALAEPEEGISTSTQPPPPPPPLPAPPPPTPRFMLNPTAQPWALAEASKTTTPEDQRSMFITFSRGHPISREDVMEFFQAKYGPCVEVVLIERAAAGQQPMYGRLVLTSASMIAVVLNGQRTAKFLIKGKHLWARVYTPRN